MKFKIKLENGEEVEVQFCRNKYGTIYARRLPYTVKNPTPKQEEVRNKFAKASFDAFNKSREEMIENIKSAFADWESAPAEKRNEIMEEIRRLYPRDAEIIIKFLQLIF
ncbi:MAG: hypothetical protein C0180_03265 [Aciduliprofundum sp.]|nr:MAG: hypothetical protein C0180_03265 [Aciduliprofundum sp.]